MSALDRVSAELSGLMPDPSELAVPNPHVHRSHSAGLRPSDLRALTTRSGHSKGAAGRYVITRMTNSIQRVRSRE